MRMSKLVMIVNDFEFQNKLDSKLLGKEGFDVKTFSSYIDAEEYLRSTSDIPDAIVAFQGAKNMGVSFLAQVDHFYKNQRLHLGTPKTVLCLSYVSNPEQNVAKYSTIADKVCLVGEDKHRAAVKQLLAPTPYQRAG